MSTLQSFPYDALSLIFLECLPYDPLSNHASQSSSDPSSISSSQAPILLCHICSHWRNVAVSTPGLWRELNFMAKVTNVNANGHIDRIEQKENEDGEGEDERQGIVHASETGTHNKETKAIISDKDLAFLSFWHRNLSNHIPSLRIGIDPSTPVPLVYLVVDLAHGISNSSQDDSSAIIGHHTERGRGARALFDLIQRAEYLDIDHHFSTALRAFASSSHSASCTRARKATWERRIRTSENLHTLIMRQGYKRPHRYMFRDIPFDEVDQTQYDSTHSLFAFSHAKFRRLFLEELSILTSSITSLHTSVSLSPNADAKLNAPDGINYASLTHIHTASLHLSLDTWFLLIRSLPSLYSGTFELIIISGVDIFASPPRVVLPELKYLAITTFGSMVNVPILLGLTLPRLKGLRINNYPWLTIRKLHDVLQSTPNLRELQLGPDHPWCEVSMGMVIPTGYHHSATASHNSGNNNSNSNNPSPVHSPSSSPTLQHTIFNSQSQNTNNHAHTSITPLWHIVPHLQYIHFSGSECRAPSSFESFSTTSGAGGSSTSRGIVRAVLNSPWLDLRRPQNQIRRIEFDAGQRGELWRRQIHKMIEDVSLNGNEDRIVGVDLVMRPETAVDLWGRKNSKAACVTGRGEQGFGRLGNWFEDSNLGFIV